MIRVLLLVALLLPGCGTVVPNAGPSPTSVHAFQWREYRPEGGRFRVQMPAQPAEVTERRGPSLVHAAIIGPMPGTMQGFTVLYRDLTEEERKVPPDEMLQRALKEGGSPTDVREVKAGQATGLEGMFAVSQDRPIRMRVFLVEGRLFTVTAMYPDTPAGTAEAMKFLDSFEPL